MSYLNYQELRHKNGDTIPGVFPTYTWFLEWAAHVELKGKKLLDVGCGEAMYSIHASNDGAECTALEFDDEKWNKAKELIAEWDASIDLVHIDAEKYKTKGKFDVVLFPMVIHWFKEKESIRRLAKLGKDHIVFIYREENDDYLPSHGNFFPTKNELIELLGFPVKVKMHKKLAQQDAGKKIMLLVLERQVQKSGKKVERKGEQYTKDWKEKVKKASAAFDGREVVFTDKGYEEDYIDGTDLFGDRSFEHMHHRKRKLRITEKQREAVIETLRKVLKAGVDSGYLFSDLTARNFMVTDKNEAFLIDFEVVDELENGKLMNKDRVQLLNKLLAQLDLDVKTDGDIKKLLKKLG